MKPIRYEKRIKKIQKKMIEKEIDLLMITPSVNFGYLFKGFFTMSERLVCACITTDDNPFLIAPAFEKERMEHTTNIDNIIGWQEEESSYKKLHESVDKKITRVALESTTKFENVLEFKKIYPNAEFLNGGKIIQEMRTTKSDAEIERMEKAGEFTAKGIQTTIENLQEGMTEIEVAKLVMQNMTKKSSEPSWALVQFDENSAIPHNHASETKLKNNSVVLIDAGTMCDHYFADITITTTFGKPSEEFLKIYEIVQNANTAALDTSREGIPAEKVDFAAREVIEKAGYGKFFTHRLGHGLGLEVHEEPYMVKGNEEPLVAGNVHTDEPGIYRPGKFGIRIEDDILVTKSSAKKLYDFNRFFWEKK